MKARAKPDHGPGIAKVVLQFPDGGPSVELPAAFAVASPFDRQLMIADALAVTEDVDMAVHWMAVNQQGLEQNASTPTERELARMAWPGAIGWMVRRWLALPGAKVENRDWIDSLANGTAFAERHGRVQP